VRGGGVAGEVAEVVSLEKKGKGVGVGDERQSRGWGPNKGGKTPFSLTKTNRGGKKNKSFDIVFGEREGREGKSRR